MKFYLKIVRNGAILTALLFFSMWAVNDINFAMCKTILIFLGTYVSTELARAYNITPANTSTTKILKAKTKPVLTTFLF